VNGCIHTSSLFQQHIAVAAAQHFSSIRHFLSRSREAKHREHLFSVDVFGSAVMAI
jgi:hypothetical protein